MQTEWIHKVTLCDKRKNCQENENRRQDFGGGFSMIICSFD